MGTPVDDELSFYDGLDIDPHNVALETWWVPTVAVADFNEDGHVDLFVSEREKKGAGKRENRLYFGTGHGDRHVHRPPRWACGSTDRRSTTQRK